MSPRLPLRVTVDATPLLGQRTGIGRYTEFLLAALAERADLQVSGMAFSLGGWRDLPAALPAGVRRVGVPVSATALRRAWRRVPFPPIELLGTRPAVVHGINFVLPPALRAAGVVTIHDLAFLTHSQTLDAASTDLEVLVPQALRRAAVVTATTGITADAIAARYNFPREAILIAPPGVDRSWFAAEPPDASLRASLRLPARYLLFVGTREPRKGLPTLLAAHATLRARRPDTPEMLLVGASGWGADQLAGAGSGVRVLDYVEYGALQRITAGAAALVLPSLDEGFGMPSVEALAAGTPVIVSDIAVLREVTGGLAATFPVGDEKALAQAISDVLEGMSPEADERRRQASRFTWEHTADVTASAYHLAASACTGRTSDPDIR